MPTQNLPQWQVSELWRVDGTDAGDGFGDLHDFDVRKDGTLWILDTRDQRIRRYDINGKALASVGRRGSGPGELRGANELRITPDGTVWLFDPGNSRLQKFSRDGKSLPSIPLTGIAFSDRWPAWFDQESGDLYDGTSGASYVEHRTAPRAIP